MLSAKKVKLHGMQDNRWTVRDKITQYKGMINLFVRDKKILDADAMINKKKLQKELKQLQRVIISSRDKLDNAVHGDRQKLRNTLQEHKEMQLTFQNSHPNHVIEEISQINFSKRKYRDRISYKMKQKSQQLIDLKLEASLLEDALKTSIQGLDMNHDTQIITGKVQNAILRKEAALSVQKAYLQILDIMKRDTIYFDAILGSIKTDGLNQGQCLIRTTELGQLATEYLDDRKQEYITLESAVKKDMKIRSRSLEMINTEANDLSYMLKFLIRRDSDISLCKINIPKTDYELELENTVDSLTNLLERLQNVLLVPNFESLHPCLVEQKRQNLRLTTFVARHKTSKNKLQNKVNHAELMLTTILHNQNDSIFKYVTQKTCLENKLQEESKRRDENKNLTRKNGNLLAYLKAGIMSIEQECKIVKGPGESDIFRNITSDETVVVPPEKVETNTMNIIGSLIPKVQALIDNTSEIEEKKIEEAEKTFQQLVVGQNKFVFVENRQEDESFMDSLIIEDSQTLSRQEIKLRSREIVLQNTKNEFGIPAAIFEEMIKQGKVPKKPLDE